VSGIEEIVFIKINFLGFDYSDYNLFIMITTRVDKRGGEAP